MPRQVHSRPERHRVGRQVVSSAQAPCPKRERSEGRPPSRDERVLWQHASSSPSLSINIHQCACAIAHSSHDCAFVAIDRLRPITTRAITTRPFTTLCLQPFVQQYPRPVGYLFNLTIG